MVEANDSRKVWEGLPKRVRAPYINLFVHLAISRVRRGTWNLVGMRGDHSVRLNTN